MLKIVPVSSGTVCPHQTLRIRTDNLFQRENGMGLTNHAAHAAKKWGRPQIEAAPYPKELYTTVRPPAHCYLLYRSTTT